jgi:hypothetical protein
MRPPEDPAKGDTAQLMRATAVTGRTIQRFGRFRLRIARGSYQEENVATPVAF